MKNGVRLLLRTLSLISLGIAIAISIWDIKFIIESMACGTGFILIIWLFLLCISVPIIMGTFAGFIALTIMLVKDKKDKP